MHNHFSLLSEELIDRVLEEAFHLLMEPGIKVDSPEAIELLASAGARVDLEKGTVHIPEDLMRGRLETALKQFYLFDRYGNPVVQYGGAAVHFDPGSSGVHVLDPETLEHRPSTSHDLACLIKIAEMLPQYDAQSTAVLCHDVPKAIGDLYRLYLVLLLSSKPVVTGAFTIETLDPMIDLLALLSGSRQALAEQPRAVFDVCPTPPLMWSDFGAQNLISLARAGVPAQIVSMPLAGATAPVTLLGSVVQHAAECLSGIAIHQLARPGAPVVWGGAPAIFDMRSGTTPMGAIETAMIDVCYAQIGQRLGLPTHTYLGASDAKLVDAQAGIESGMSALVGALAGINMISGAGMLDFLACQSAEKLVIDAEAIAMVKRLLDGVVIHTETLATAMFDGIEFKGNFLRQKVTRQLFKVEQHLPSAVIDRQSLRGWSQEGSQDTFRRAKSQVAHLLRTYQPPDLPQELSHELERMVAGLARTAGLDHLPELKIHE